MAARFTQQTATIAVGQSLSSAISCSAGAPVLVFVPSIWTPSRLTFQVSPDGTNWFDLFDRNAIEMAFNVVPGTAVLLDTGWAPVQYFRVRSGGRDMPIQQDDVRTLTITIDTQAAMV